jgi:hypothetical protein
VPSRKQLIISDITVETIGERLQENPPGLLLYVDELDVLLGNMGRYNSGRDLPHYITIHNGKLLKVDRKTHNVRIHVPRPSVVIIGGIQPFILRKRLEENPDFLHSGFFARFLLAMPPGRTPRLGGEVIPDAVQLRYERLVADILSSRESTQIGGKVYPMVFPIARAAWDTLVEYQHKHATIADYETDANATIEGKFLTNAARIALILHVAELTEGGTPLSGLTSISGETMLNACIVAEWFVNEAIRINATLAPTLDESGADAPVADGLTDAQRKVMLILQRKGKPMTSNEIRFKHNRTKTPSIEQVDATLVELKQLGKVKPQHRQHKGGKGAPATEWKTVENS